MTERNETMSDEQRWSSLARPTPQWFEDAPLGIFVHWGPYSVPAWAEDHGELGVERGDVAVVGERERKAGHDVSFGASGTWRGERAGR